MRKSTVMLSLLLALGLGFGAALLHAAGARRARVPVLARSALLVRQLGLTDLALFTEARYTRHLSQSDLHSAFQDHPLSLDHFPSGSIVAPPLRAARGR